MKDLKTTQFAVISRHLDNSSKINTGDPYQAADAVSRPENEEEIAFSLRL
jgi:hypothetical protein